MIRTLTLAATLAASLALPVLAETPAGAVAARGALFTEKQAREHLVHLGYTNVSGLTKDENGVWHGAANNKDGKALTVAVDVKGAAKR